MRAPVIRRVFPAALVILTLVGAACDVSVDSHGLSFDVASGKAVDEWTRTYTLPKGGSLIIQNANGPIEAERAAGDTVEVRAERIAKAHTDEAARELLQKIELAEEVGPDRVRIETRAPRGRTFRGSHEVRYHVRVPAGLQVSFETVNGGVRLRELEGRISAATTNGGIRGSGLRASINASTTNGGVELALAAVTGDVDVGTTNGGVRLELPRDVKATIEASCTNGGIRVEGFEAEGVEKTRRSYTARLNGGGVKINASTTNGGIRIRPAGGTQAH